MLIINNNFEMTMCVLGSFLVTLDVHKGDCTEAESSLKFWYFETAQNRYRLSSQVIYHSVYF